MQVIEIVVDDKNATMRRERLLVDVKRPSNGSRRTAIFHGWGIKSSEMVEDMQ